MNKKVIAVGFSSLLVASSLVNLLWPKRSFTENENRYLQQFPSMNSEDILSGKFTRDFETYASDQFFGRDGWISLKTASSLAMLKKDNGRVYFGEEGTLFDAAETIDNKQLDKNTQAVVRYIRKLREKTPDLKASVLLVPTASAIKRSKLPAFAPVPDQRAGLDRVSAAVGDTAKVCNPLDLLKAHSDEYLYYKTDHHWTTDGAYLVYTEWAEQNGLEPTPYGAFSVESVSDSFLGTLYSKANLLTLKPDTIDVYRYKQPIAVTADYGRGKVTDSLYFDEYLLQKDQYSYFLGTNQPLVEIHTGTKNGRTLLVLQDSYSHCFIPFLTAHYENILVLDPRYNPSTDYTTYAEEKGVTDLLVLYNLPNFSIDKNIAGIA